MGSKKCQNGTYNNGEKKVVFCSKRETNKRTERKREREKRFLGVSEFGLILRGAVLLWRPTHSLPSEEGTGVLWVSTVWCSHPDRMMREHQSASSLLAWLFVEWKLPVVSVAVDHWLSVNWICPPTGRKKNNDERERGPEKRRWKNWDNDDYFSKNNEKGSKQGVEKVRKRHTLKRRRVFKKTMFTESM